MSVWWAADRSAVASIDVAASVRHARRGGDAVPLREYMAPLPEHIDSAVFEDRYVAMHVQKELNCNWKIARVPGVVRKRSSTRSPVAEKSRRRVHCFTALSFA